tara:strand:+ start:526 stop:762 length:237 start_codon:yes stop_codon:yes gene_type:complete
MNDQYRKPNVFLSDQDIITLQNIIHKGWHVEYVEIGDPNLHSIRMPIVHTDKEEWSARLQGILLRLDEGLEHVDTIHE